MKKVEAIVTGNGHSTFTSRLFNSQRSSARLKKEGDGHPSIHVLLHPRHRTPSEFHTLPPRATPSKRTVHLRATLPFLPHLPHFDPLHPAAPRSPSPAPRSRARRPPRAHRARPRTQREAATRAGLQLRGRRRRGISRCGRGRCAHGARGGVVVCAMALRTCVPAARGSAGGARLRCPRRRTMVGRRSRAMRG